ncbi:hypothetical protein GCM10010371_40250 [Streptomyces subrutilus]|uniref:Uncharacterized protein n=1 Tax=Streptomyces subrutilus TaxID=36818 RepID=A0A918QYZ3_9ACTN|nr:hypothetical protein GCM10010371_40250 [Streptomyces subrutilus]
MPAPSPYVALDMTSGSLPAMDIDWFAVVAPSTRWTRTSTAASATSTTAATAATSLRSTTPPPTRHKRVRRLEATNG